MQRTPPTEVMLNELQQAGIEVRQVFKAFVPFGVTGDHLCGKEVGAEEMSIEDAWRKLDNRNNAVKFMGDSFADNKK